MPRRGWTPAARRINGRRLERNRKFVDSPLEEDGFELSVPPKVEPPEAESPMPGSAVPSPTTRPSAMPISPIFSAI
jgi:hypothetical protein